LKSSLPAFPPNLSIHQTPSGVDPSIAEHLILVAAIEDAEGSRFRARCREQSLVRRVVPHR
jgi:hypothetical protein